MNVLITGGAGFIGSHIIEHLLSTGFPGGRKSGFVRVLDNLSTGKSQNLQPFLNKIEFIHGDLLDDAVRERAVKGVDVIFHEAAIPSVPRSIEEPLSSHLHGAHSTLLLLDSARRHNVKRLVYAGSSSAYGNVEVLPQVETMLPRPKSPYAASKLSGEFYAQVFSECYGLDTVTLRYFNIFGPRQDPGSPYSGVIAKFCTAFCKNEPLIIFGDGEQSRDFTFVANVAQANLLAACAKEPLGGRVFNIGCGKRSSLNRIVELLNQFTGQSRNAEYKPDRAGDVKHSLADISRAQQTLGYNPEVSFEEGLKKTLEWARNS
jgi:UDP-glucose 4-epimerase